MTLRLTLAVSIATTAALITSGCAGSESADSARSASGDQTGDATGEESGDGVVETSDNVDIGGRSLYLQCWGELVPGEPTVLLLSGQGPPTSYWEPLASSYAAEGHHVCGYDRAGVGASDPAPEARRTTKDQVDDLVALLDLADLEEPLAVVAHSLGSIPAVGLVERAPERVAGVVFVDPVSPRMSATLVAALPPKKPLESAALTDERRFLTDYLADPTQNPENLLLAASEKEAVVLLDKPGPIFGDLPVVVLQAPVFAPPGLPRHYRETMRKAAVDGNMELAAESTRGKVVLVEDTSHNIHVDQPEVVIEAIRDVIAR